MCISHMLDNVRRRRGAVHYKATQMVVSATAAHMKWSLARGKFQLPALFDVDGLPASRGVVTWKGEHDFGLAAAVAGLHCMPKESSV